MKNLPFFMLVMAFLSGIQAQCSEQLRSDLGVRGGGESEGGKIVLQNQVLEVKKEIAGGSTIQIFDSNTKNLPGICNFDEGGKLKTGRVVVFDQVSISYATDAASGKVAELEYDTKVPKELQNAWVIITQEGRTVLEMPVRDLTNIATGFKAEDEYTQLKGLCYFVDNKQIDISIKFPEGVVLGAGAKHYIQFRFNGLQTAKKPNV